MKAPCPKGLTEAFTLIELLVVLAMIAILVAMATPTFDHRPVKADLIRCHNHLRQVGVGMLVWAEDHGDQFPQQISASNGWTLEFGGGQLAIFQSLTRLSNTVTEPSTWHCPTDKSKKSSTNYNDGLSAANVSYFLSLDAEPTMPRALLAGDRNLRSAGRSVSPGLFTLMTNLAIGWTHDLHSKGKRDVGNVLFADGHVEPVETNWQAIVQSQNLATNRLAVP